MMTLQDEQRLKNEIRHIFESGPNEIRIFEMIEAFMAKRVTPGEEYIRGYKDGWTDARMLEL